MKISEINIPKQIYILTGFTTLLCVGRVMLFGSTAHLYLLWNIFLAFLPFLISSVLVWHIDHKKVSLIGICITGIFWFLLFPNAPYLVTDLVHLGESFVVPIWYDSLLLFSCSVVGMTLASHSLFHIEHLLKERYSRHHVRSMLAFLLLFSSFGIYIGRFLRFNSWDVFTDNVNFFKNIWRVLSGSSHFPEAYEFTALFFIFLWVFYIAWKHSKEEHLSRKDLR